MPITPCINTPPVHGVVTFDPTVFVQYYPEFTGLTNGVMMRAFNHATLQLNNTCQSLVCDAAKREILLGMLTAHILLINNGTNDGAGNINPPSGVVGRLAQATEGSVSLGAEWNAPPNPSQAYYIQTKYGAEFWQATARYRTMRYIAPQNNNPIGPIFRGF